MGERTLMAVSATLHRIRSDARALRPSDVALTLIALPLAAVGWLVGKAFLVVWTGISWAWTAGFVGWQAATADRRR